MCGIVGAISHRNITPILVDGLKRLEYRGYDSAGVAVLDDQACLNRVRTVGKIANLKQELEKTPADGHIGIGHTRWATHGEPATHNAHPHVCKQTVALVHNGIIENFEGLKNAQLGEEYLFTSDTDSEVIVHQLHKHLNKGEKLLTAVQKTVAELEGAYALGVVYNREPDKLVAARRGSPLVIGIGEGENFIASDMAALLPVTNRFYILEEGDVAVITRDGVTIYDEHHQPVERPIHESKLSADAVERGEYAHYMLKEIYEQPHAIAETLEGRLGEDKVLEASFGPKAAAIFEKTRNIQIVACGTSYHAGLIAKYGFESVTRLPCNVEVASEFRYRKHVVQPDTLFITISQSGETADTLAALRLAKELGYEHTLTICNVPESSLVRESELSLMTRAGPEIGVASTKAFTTQLVAILLLLVVLARRHGLSKEIEAKVVDQLRHLPSIIEEVLGLDGEIQKLAENFADKQHALFLGRGMMYPVALEGALKLKEISYIHAEGYPAGELKHGPLALVDANVPVVAVAPNDKLLDKLKSNLQEVRARGGKLYVFADQHAGMRADQGVTVLDIAPVDIAISPIIYTVPLQLLAYHVALLKGTDVDQPRNLAKSVTVE
ncbi:glutamine--fructose-6-phosphate transaminase (isomerizing) [Thiohalophilus sp.]|uniref:glutamine--fructose-6-phosphate transaminase (isomerizing) n=1 Tax=Thiohalophilus sp. TaxID=3028392 RepID=UPI002ACD2E36|nr:glutamine--fructose-6-phosphate transaminase (isomerizing) [Thiohalophilus sp.]MDZ7803300.1 glutamine--fructose-6-phosphate transaminase (isomerizing) [Thiohalophilus sp.]